MSDELRGKRICIFVGDDYEDMELQYPKYRLIEAGAQVVVAGLAPGVFHKGKHGYPQRAEAAIRDLDANDFDGLVIAGGWMPDKLRRDDDVKLFTRLISDAGKCVASICHGPWICISAGIVQGATYTSSPGIKDDLINAGAKWVDQPVCIDGHHVSSRKPDDVPAFCKGIIQVMTGVAQAV